MGFIMLVGVLLAVGACAENPAIQDSSSRVLDPIRNADVLADTELRQAFVIFRHGDRTPDPDEVILYPESEQLSNNIYFPYGKKALTNKGKRRAYSVGKYMRKRYDGFLSRLYLDDEIEIRTTNYARTQMSALAALAALYPPPPAQRWNPSLNWQPVPYDTPPFAVDDLLYWYNCPLYTQLRNQAYNDPEVKEWLQPYKGLFKYLQEKTGQNITTSEDVFFLDNLFQALKNVGVSAPEWANKVMPEIKEVTKIEYAVEFFTPTLIRLASGVLMDDILNATSSYIACDVEQPKMWLYSAHENNVAALMAAANVFEPHQPNYGATFSLELRKKKNGRYGIAAVYAKDAGGPGQVLTIKGCEGELLCDYDKFVSAVKENTWTREEFEQKCNIKS